MTPELDEIWRAAKTLIRHVETYDDLNDVNFYLAELEPYPKYVLQLVKVEE